MTVLVTGATGFLGQHLCGHLVGRGQIVRALVRPGRARCIPHGVEVAWGDVRDPLAVRQAVEGCTAVIHAAAMFRLWGDAQEFEEHNVLGTRQVLEAARLSRVGRFVYASTFAVIGRPLPGRVIDEQHPCDPRDPYQRTKLEAERMALRYYEQHGLPVIVVRPGAFYGPGSHYAFNRLFFDDPLRGLLLQVHGGRRVICPVFVGDVAQGIAACLERGRAGQVYNLSGKSITHREANAIISRLTGRTTWRFDAPAPVMLALAHIWNLVSRFTHREPYYPITLASYVFHDWVLSSEKAKRELGFEQTPFEEGARQTVEWYRQIGMLRTKSPQGFSETPGG